MPRSVIKIRDRVGTRGYHSRPREVVGTLWPHGEFSLAWRHRKLEETSWEAEESWRGSAARACRLPGAPLLDSAPEFSQPPQAACEKRKNGLKGITGFGRRMVQSAVAVAARKLGQERLVFCTLTLPPLQAAERCLVAASWGETLRQLLQWLSRRLERAKAPPVVVSVSEIQPKRLSLTGEGYLHLHLAWPAKGQEKDRWAVEVCDLRAWWEARIKRVTGLPSIPTVQIKLETVRSNVSGYMAKYMSKGAEGLEEYRRDCGDQGVPGQWWNMTKEARDWVKAEVQKGREAGEVLEAFIGAAFDGVLGDFPGALHHYDLVIEGKGVTIAYYGYLVEYAMKDLQSMVKSAVNSPQMRG